MTETAPKLPVKSEHKALAPHLWRPFEGLRQEVERLFDDFDRGVWRSPFRRSLFAAKPG